MAISAVTAHLHQQELRLINADGQAVATAVARDTHEAETVLRQAGYQVVDGVIIETGCTGVWHIRRHTDVAAQISPVEQVLRLVAEPVATPQESWDDVVTDPVEVKGTRGFWDQLDGYLADRKELAQAEDQGQNVDPDSWHALDDLAHDLVAILAEAAEKVRRAQ